MKGLERRTTTLNLSQINESLKCLFGIIPAARERERERERENGKWMAEEHSGCGRLPSSSSSFVSVSSSHPLFVITT